MQDPNASHRQQWQPPPRPEWVRQVNEEGRCMDISGVVPLDERSLLDTAMRNTGLSDFGADDWREPFSIFVKALQEESELNLMGRIKTRSDILILLEARLRIEDTYKRHPEIEDEQIVQPIIIVGQGRSGTSFMQNVLSANPDNGVLMHWEEMFPCPPPEKATYKTDPRIEKANLLLDQWNRITPSLQSMHELAGNMPFENCATMAINFMSPNYLGCFGQVPRYESWIMQQDIVPGLRYDKRVLKLLQWKNPRRQWILKDPMHLDRFAAVLDVYPDACFVWPHRDPVRALVSMVSICGTLHWIRSDHPFKGGSYDYLTDPYMIAGRLNAVIDQLDSGIVPEGQMFHLLYRDLVDQTLPMIEAMYRHFNITLSANSRTAIAEHLAANPRDARPAHMFNAGSKEAVARAREAFSRYQQRFGIPDE